jgi:integrase
MPTPKTRDKFPLWLHPRGFWCKKINGRFFYFGKDKDAALAEYVRVREDLEAGRTPRPKEAADLTVAQLINEFLTRKRERVDAGELSARAWADYYRACEAVVDSFGKGRAVADLRPDDFAKLRTSAAARLGPVALLNFVTRAKMVFRHGYEFGLIDAPVRYGAAFDPPTRSTLRRERAKKPAKLIGAADLWTLILAADPQLRAMLWLGINCGFGPSDCAQLTRHALGVRLGWIDFPRPKTGIARRCPLWPETVKALAAVAAVRPDPQDPKDADLVFLTRTRRGDGGNPWVRFKPSEDPEREGQGSALDAVGPAFRKLAKKCGVAVVGGPYTLRHVFRTVADEVHDRPAIDTIMGHTDESMASHYRERIDDARLLAVTEHVRQWLLAGKSKKRPAKKVS